MHSTIKKNPLGFFPACIGVEFLCLSIYVFPCPNVHIMNVMVYAKTLPPGFVGRPVGLESTALPIGLVRQRTSTLQQVSKSLQRRPVGRVYGLLEER